MSDDALARIQLAKLADLLRAIHPGNELYRRKLEEARVDVPASLAAAERRGFADDLLAGLPLTTKPELQADQEEHPPFGTDLTYPIERYVRFHRTSGTSGRPMMWLDTAESWLWVLGCWERIYRGIGLTPADRVFFPFSFGPFLGFWSAFEGAMRHGCLCVPGGGMTTIARLWAIRELGVTAIAATPTYALRMAEVAGTVGFDLASTPVRAVIVAGEPGGSIPSTKARIEAAWGARCFDHCGMTEVGPVGFECPASPGGMHVLEEDYIVEVLAPRSTRRVEGGAEGELVLTNLGRTGSPAIRYRTGDLVRWTRGPCACGSAYGRLEGGILGRIDDMVFVRGNNVYPAAVEAILRAFREVAEYRIRLRTQNEMTHLVVEVELGEPIRGDRRDGGAGPRAEAVRERIRREIETRLLFDAEVVVVPPESLPRFELKAKRWIREDKP